MPARLDKAGVLARLNVRAYWREHLPGYRDSVRDNVMTPCPFHDDRAPSLSVTTVPPGKWKCHGCGEQGDVFTFHQRKYGATFEEALAAIAAYAAGSQPVPEPPTARQFRLEDAAVVYDYADADGRVVYKVARYIPKAFRPFSPVGPGGSWVQGLNVVPRVLYGLPAVLDAKAAGHTIYVAEGEKDADSINAVDGNHCATTWAGGADGWNTKHAPGYAETLAGAAHVVVVRDRDEPGARCAARVYVALRGRVARLEVVESQAGKDATDHLEAGHPLSAFVPIPEREALRSLGDEAPAPDTVEPLETATAEELLGVRIEPVEMIIPGWAQPDTALIVAPGGTNKTLFMFSVALALGSGTKVLGEWVPARAYRVLVMQEEDPPDLSTLRVQRLVRGMGLTADDLAGRVHFTRFRSGFHFGDAALVARLKALLAAQQFDLVLIDSVSKVASIEDQNAREEVTAWFRDQVETIKREYRCGVGLVHHSNKLAHQKNPTVELAGMITGNQAFIDNADAVGFIQGVRGKRDQRMFTWSKTRRGMKPRPWLYEISDLFEPYLPPDQCAVRLLYTGVVEEDQLAEAKKAVKADQILRANPGQWFDAKRLAALSECTERHLRDKASEMGWQKKAGGGQGSKTEYRVVDEE